MAIGAKKWLEENCRRSSLSVEDKERFLKTLNEIAEIENDKVLDIEDPKIFTIILLDLITELGLEILASLIQEVIDSGAVKVEDDLYIAYGESARILKEE